MRIIDVSNAAVRTVAVSPDGQLVAVSTEGRSCALYRWTGELALPLSLTEPCDQFAFAPVGGWVASVQHGRLWFDNAAEPAVPQDLPGPFAGGVALSPDGKRLVATRGGANQGKLACWDLPAFRPTVGFDFLEPFRRLAFSPNGQFLAGIWPYGFVLRFAASGGLDVQHPSRAVGRRRAGPTDPVGFVSFTRDSGTCAFGWDGEFRVLDIATGTSKKARPVEAPFRDAAFTGSGRHLATVEDTGRLKLWDATTWQVAREYDWGCGPLTCVAFTANGRLVQFDVDE